jgi:tetratricopeptide (TPR) repeat protein
MMMLNQHKQACDLVEQCLEDYSSYPDLAQFRFLAARCLIAEIEFEAAKEQLQKIVEGTTNKPSQNAQAFWMLGEVNFLQRDYAAAIQQYKQAMQIGEQPAWHARSLIQMAKCFELQAAPLDAMAAYQAVVSNYPNSDVAENARARLEQLTRWNQGQIATPLASQSTKSQPPKIQR